MTPTKTELQDVVILEPTVFEDERGSFFEAWNERTFRQATGVDAGFVQDNHSTSVAGVIRGIHYQLPRAQGKLVRCVRGAIWDVAVDLRASSDQYLSWVGVELSAANRRQLWIPEGHGHGFVALSEAEVLYKVTSLYDPESDRAVRWDDPEVGIEWPLVDEPTVSAKDAAAPLLAHAEVFA